jgi:AGZA family xanthine/uracil permease-like MFS transporter
MNRATVKQEVVAGLTSFLAAAYLVVVIPTLLSTGGMDRVAATTATLALMSIFSLAMGWYANFPFVVGPGLGVSVMLGVDFSGVFTARALPYLFAFFAGEFFSTLGTTLAVGAKAGLTDPHGNLPHIERAFLVDSVAATLGPLVGIPALTALVESAAGAEAGGRTGLTAIVAAAGFAAMLLVTPLVLVIPKEATAPALIIIGISMLQTFRGGASETLIDGLPALLMMLLTLISNSFGIGIAGGVVFYVLVQILAGRIRELSPGLMLLVLPLAYYLYGAATAH